MTWNSRKPAKELGLGQIMSGKMKGAEAPLNDVQIVYFSYCI